MAPVAGRVVVGYCSDMSKKVPPKHLKLVPPAQGRDDWLDDEAKALLRLGAMRLLREVAGVDDAGRPKELQPRVAKEAIVALSLLFDRVPDVLTFDKRSNGELLVQPEHRTPLDLLTGEGRQMLIEAVRELPDDVIEAAMEDTG